MNKAARKALVSKVNALVQWDTDFARDCHWGDLSDIKAAISRGWSVVGSADYACGGCQSCRESGWSYGHEQVHLKKGHLWRNLTLPTGVFYGAA